MEKQKYRNGPPTIKAQEDIRTGFFSLFPSWLINKGKVAETQTATTKRAQIEIWLLNQQQLRDMGIRGIKQFWFPSTDNELSNFLYQFDLKRELFFIGDKKQNISQCMQ